MAEHTVNVKTPALEVGKVDVVFTIRRDGTTFGRLKISRGGVEWMPSWKSKKAFHMPWDEFDGVFREHGTEGITKSGKRK
jgi:hypothetical protein